MSTSIQVPIHQDSCRFLRFIADGKVYQFQALCFGLLTGVYEGHDSNVGHASQPGRQDTEISRQMAYSRLLQGGGNSGEGQGSAIMCLTWNYCQSGKGLSSTIPDSDLSGDGHRESLFEGFSNSKEDRDPSGAHRGIFILQTAKCRLLAMSAGSVVFPMPSGARESVTLEVSSAGVEVALGLQRRVGCFVMDSGDLV